MAHALPKLDSEVSLTVFTHSSLRRPGLEINPLYADHERLALLGGSDERKAPITDLLYTSLPGENAIRIAITEAIFFDSVIFTKNHIQVGNITIVLQPLLIARAFSKITNKKQKTHINTFLEINNIKKIVESNRLLNKIRIAPADYPNVLTDEVCIYPRSS